MKTCWSSPRQATTTESDAVSFSVGLVEPSAVRVVVTWFPGLGIKLLFNTRSTCETPITGDPVYGVARALGDSCGSHYHWVSNRVSDEIRAVNHGDHDLCI